MSDDVTQVEPQSGNQHIPQPHVVKRTLALLDGYYAHVAPAASSNDEAVAGLPVDEIIDDAEIDDMLW